jgi:hypothetical protein
LAWISPIGKCNGTEGNIRGSAEGQGKDMFEHNGYIFETNGRSGGREPVRMNGFVSPLKGNGSTGRVRTPVGHRYLEALQSRAAGSAEDDSTCKKAESARGEEGLNFLVLGMTSGTMMDDIDFALCRFTQKDPEAPLALDIVQVIPPLHVTGLC